jgi:hypothetical protein
VGLLYVPNVRGTAWATGFLSWRRGNKREERSSTRINGLHESHELDPSPCGIAAHRARCGPAYRPGRLSILSSRISQRIQRRSLAKYSEEVKLKDRRNYRCAIGDRASSPRYTDTRDRATFSHISFFFHIDRDRYEILIPRGGHPTARAGACVSPITAMVRTPAAHSALTL